MSVNSRHPFSNRILLFFSRIEFWRTIVTISRSMKIHKVRHSALFISRDEILVSDLCSKPTEELLNELSFLAKKQLASDVRPSPFSLHRSDQCVSSAISITSVRLRRRSKPMIIRMKRRARRPLKSNRKRKSHRKRIVGTAMKMMPV